MMGNEEKTSLNIRYSGIHVMYFMSYCAAVGYASVYLLNRGFNNTTIGLMLSISNIAAVILQSVLANYIDKSTKLSLSTLTSIVAMGIAFFSAVLYLFSSVSDVLILCIIPVFIGIIFLQPFINSLSFSFEKYGYRINFGIARGIGSVAYAVTSLVLGNLLEIYSPSILPLLYTGMAIVLWVNVFTFKPGKKDEVVKEEKTENVTGQLSMMQFVKKYRRFMVLLVGVVLMYFNSTIVGNFFIQVISNVGGTSKDMGNAIFIAAVLELPTMVLFSKVCKKVNCNKLLIISGIFFTIKHVLILLAKNMTVIYIAQATQMFGNALFVPASVYYVSRLVDRQDMTKGQALIFGAITLSGVFATSSGGILLDVIGVPNLLLIGTIISAIGSVVFISGVENV